MIIKLINKIDLNLIISVLCMIIFTTCGKIEREPKVETGQITDIASESARAAGNLIDIGDGISSHFHCWSITSNPDFSDSRTSLGRKTNTGSFTSNLQSLQPGTKYYIKAYAQSGDVIVYGNELSFTTISVSLPTLTTTQVSEVTQTTALSGGNITSDGGGTITERGVCWATITNPTVTNSKTIDGSGIGVFASSITGLTPSTSYHVRAYAKNSAGTAYGNQVNFVTIIKSCIPELLSPANNAVMDNGCSNGSDQASWFFDWNDCPNATSYNLYVTYPSAFPVINITTTESQFSFPNGGYIIDNNLLDRTWKVRALIDGVWGEWSPERTFDVEPLNTDCPSETFRDIDGNLYNTVTIGSQVWLKEDLKTTRYLNGDLIGTTSPYTKDISTELNPSYQWPAGANENNVPTHGRLYTYFAVIDSRGLCPTGWHVPTDGDWVILINNYGGEYASGDALKESGTNHWITGNTGTNTSGFTALPIGGRSSNGVFTLNGLFGDWLSSTESSATMAIGRYLFYNSNRASTTGSPKDNASAVRCIKD